MKQYTDHEKKQNLLKLAEYLLGDLKAKFDMGTFSQIDERLDASTVERFRINETDCGSVGCAIGHGPYAGIPKGKESWRQYYNRSFRIYDHGFNTEYFWLFDARWVDVDNSSEGAAKRILWFLVEGDAPSDELSTSTYQRRDIYPKRYLFPERYSQTEPYKYSHTPQ